MPCTDPLTRSAGFVFLEYNHTSQGLTHRTHIRMGDGQDPADVVTWGFFANGWKTVLAPMLPPQFTIVGWGTQNPSGGMVLIRSFSSPFVGTNSVASGALDYKSRTVTFTGHGTPTVGSGCAGEAMSRIFVGAAYEFLPGQKFITAGAEPEVDAVADFLVLDPTVWCDFYGQPAGVRGRYPTQINARVQRKYGT